MPYINQDYRKELIPLMDALADKINEIHNRHPEQTKDGLLNYSVTEILNKTFPDPRYTDFNEIIGLILKQSWNIFLIEAIDESTEEFLTYSGSEQQADSKLLKQTILS